MSTRRKSHTLRSAKETVLDFRDGCLDYAEETLNVFSRRSLSFSLYWLAAPFFNWLLIGAIPAALVSIAVLVYLFRPDVTRVFELGPGPCTRGSANDS